LHKPITRFFAKHLNASRGILSGIKTPVSRQIEHLPEEGYQTIRAIRRRLPDLRMEPCHIIAGEIREFSRAKDREMGGEHRPVIAAGAFAWRMPLEILRGEIGKSRLVQAILPDLCGIVALRNGAHMCFGQRARLIHRERAIGPNREAAHPTANPLFQDEGLPPLGDPQRKARQLGITHEHLARGGKRGFVNELFRQSRHVRRLSSVAV
jgi:hypothetical protein